MSAILVYAVIFFGILGIIILAGEGYLSTSIAMILTFAIIGVGFMSWAIPSVLERNRPPEGYYEVAAEHVISTYGKVSHQNRSDLVEFLNRIEPFPGYNQENFTSFESSAKLEWILEGAGFEGHLVVGRRNKNSPAVSWVTVSLEGENIAIDPLKFTKNGYDPPGLSSYDDFESQSFDSLREVISNRTRTDWDWWNIAPYNGEKPFSEWD